MDDDLRGQSDRLSYPAKYGYVTNRDGLFAGRNDFNAQVFCGKVQGKF